MISKQRVCGALLFVSFFTTVLPALAARGVRAPAAARAVEWSITKDLAPVWTFVERIWEKIGSSIDPLGSKAGSSIDPAGNPTPGVVAPPVSGDSTTENFSGTPPGRP